MKKIIRFLTSTAFMGFLLLSLASAMAAATFIENGKGAAVARAMVYDAWWFELLMLLAAINLTGNMIIYKTWKKKFVIFLYHLAFLFILLGAAITRYISFEGNMHIREGASSDKIYTFDPYIYGRIVSGGEQKDFAYKALFFEGRKNDFSHTLKAGNKTYNIRLLKYLPHARKNLIPDPSGSRFLSLVFLTDGKRDEILLREGESITVNGKKVGFGAVSGDVDFHIFPDQGALFFTSREPVYQVTMQSGGSRDTLQAGLPHPFTQGSLYLSSAFEIVPRKLYEKSRYEWIASGSNHNLPAAVTLLLSDGTNSKQITLPALFYEAAEPSHIEMGGAAFTLSFGSRAVKLPFSLYLKDFQLERYPGSDSPSSYASEVILTDKKENLRLPYRIYMNHTLKYKGYKFFQSSYDPDEKGTILSVNHDMLGTTVTYIGYFLMTLGMILSIFNRKSRFMLLARKTGVSGGVAKTVALTVILLGSHLAGVSAGEGSTSAPDKSTSILPPAMADDFETVLVQDPGGRIKPFYTLASEVMRKVMRKEKYEGQDPMQVVLGMYFRPQQWQHVPMIRVSGEVLPDMMGITGRYASYSDFFDPANHFEYKLKQYVREAYQRPPVARSKLDQDIMKLDERLNVCYMVYSGRFFRIFPAADDPEHHWYAPGEAIPHIPQEDSLFVSTVLQKWFAAATTPGQEGMAREILTSLKNYQKSRGGEIIPPASKIKLEVFYAKHEIFSKLTGWYGLLGFILLILLFIRIVRRQPLGGLYAGIFSWLLLLGFLAHTAGLGIRWYISGHAPWSNGYESMIYIAWAGMLAGLLFVRRSPFALAAAAILSSLTLFVAHLSWMNPEITNLVPVLKSYWLTLHVSVITASYGFLGMGMVIGLLNLLLYIMKTSKNHEHIARQQEILSRINEMALILGVYFLTIGTFLGGVWANESWGRYWGWDPKETWALITVLVYAFVVHMRLIPGLRGYFAFNVASVLAFFSVIMTYFGVNYYLSGLHSYAQGDAVPVPSAVFYILALLLAVIAFAWYKEEKFRE